MDNRTPAGPYLYNFDIVWGKDENGKDDITQYRKCQVLMYHDGEVTFFDSDGNHHTIQKSNFRDIILLKPQSEPLSNWINQFGSMQGRL